MNRDIQEQQLWGALCAGDQDALQKLYVSYYNGLLQYGLKYSDDRDTLKDSINSTFLYIWENRAGLSYANHVGSYIFKSYQRQLLKDLNKNKVLEKLSLSGEWDADMDIQDFQFIVQQEESIRMSLLKNAILKLPKRQRELIRMRYYEELSYDEIAKQTQLTKRAIYNQIHTAISTLKEDSSLLNLKQLLSFLIFF